MGDAIHKLAIEGLQITRHVADLDAALSDVDVCIAPLRLGADLKGKILHEACALLQTLYSA